MTYVLIHGGGATARFWDRLLPHVDGPALAVDLPGRGAHPADLGSITVADEVASVVSDVEAAAIAGGHAPAVTDSVSFAAVVNRS